MGIVTKKGDGGKTKLLSGETVSKADPRLAAVGTLDELVSALGIAKSSTDNPGLSSEITSLQQDLFRLGSELSSPKVKPTSPSHIKEIEEKIAAIESTIKLPTSLITPGATLCSSGLDLARAISRRLEREVVAIREAKGYENDHLIVYLNRLSDYLFLLARRADSFKE